MTTGNGSFSLIHKQSSGGSGTGGYAAPLFTTMTPGLTTFTNAALVGATELNFIIVNNIVETLNVEFTFNIGTGTITRTNIWIANDTLIVPHKPL